MSNAIHNPALAGITSEGDNISTFTIEPLHPGYGNTLGNSLRRVLLSSVEGAAITSYRIEGVSHEFTTIDGIKEDAVDIMLNIKNIRLRVFSDNPVELTLSKKGAGKVLASDIQANADVEIVNPQQIIATIDDPNARLTIHFVAQKGRGYLTIEESSESRIHSDMVALDAVYSPVLRVRYKVEKTRVGQISNLDKLVLTVETSGAITPQDAFEEAAAILVNQYSALAGSTQVEAAPALGQEDDTENQELNTLIEDLSLSARTANALVNNNIRTLNDLVNLSEQDLRELKGFGSKALDEVKLKLTELDLYA